MVYRRVVRPVLFRAHGGDAERVHEQTLAMLGRLSGHPRAVSLLRRWYAPDSASGGRNPASAGCTVFGVRFPGPVGLAAGMDKDGTALAAWPALGFGFVEVGTVTQHAQPGNPRPRLFRLPASEAIVNRMGFNNHGAAALAQRLRVTGKPPIPLGISLGKSKVTPVAEAVGDYVASLRELHCFADYVAVNVSSPNTPGLRSLQDRGQLTELLAALTTEARTLAAGTAAGKPVPLLVKVAPDLTEEALGELLEVCTEQGVSGLIATNTTLSREGLAVADAARGAESGGLSGRPLAYRALGAVQFVVRETGGRLPVIGVGGVLDPDDAVRLVDAGASLIQLYTGLIYRGPALVRQLNRALSAWNAAMTGRQSW